MQLHALLFSPVASDIIAYFLIRQEHVVCIAHELHLPVSQAKCKFLEGTKRRAELSSNFQKAPPLHWLRRGAFLLNDAPLHFTQPALNHPDCRWWQGLKIWGEKAPFSSDSSWLNSWLTCTKSWPECTMWLLSPIFKRCKKKRRRKRGKWLCKKMLEKVCGMPETSHRPWQRMILRCKINIYHASMAVALT